MKNSKYIANLWQEGDVVTSSKLNNMEEGIRTNDLLLKNKADISHNHEKHEIKGLEELELKIPTSVSELKNDSKYATENYVINKISEASLGGGNGEVNLSGYATKDDLLLKADKTHTHSEYLTEHQNISHLSSMQYVNDTINTKMNNKNLWCGTQSEYDSISWKDSNTLYFIKEA